MAAANSAIMIAGALVLPATIAGMIEASTAPKPSHAARESTIGRRASSIPPPPPASPGPKPMAQLLDVHIMIAAAAKTSAAIDPPHRGPTTLSPRFNRLVTIRLNFNLPSAGSTWFGRLSSSVLALLRSFLCL